MSVRIRYRLDERQVAAMPLTLSITMTVEAWRKLRTQLEGPEWPTWDLRRSIDDAIRSIGEVTDKEWEAS